MPKQCIVFKIRLMGLGFIKGSQVELKKIAPLRDPIDVIIKGYDISLRKSEARNIDKLQKDILSIVDKEEPFDVFICYKESDENGDRTRDSLLAQDIYYQLTEQGRKVFFARITRKRLIDRFLVIRPR